MISIDWSDPEASVLALLVCGHALGDFVFQTRWMVENKARSRRALALHAIEIAGVHAAVILWFAWSMSGVAILLGVAASHYLVDGFRSRLELRWPNRPLTWLLLDQGLHLAFLWTAWRYWPTIEAPGVDTITTGRTAVIVAVYAFNVNGGSAVVGCLLRGLRFGDDDRTTRGGAGRMIGILERLLIVTLVWLGQWGAVGLVLTAKSVARFKRLEEQQFAEIYLVGTMSSVIVAMAGGLLLNKLA